MEKAPRSLVLGATPFFCLLLLSLLYTVEIRSRQVPSNQWKKTHSGVSRIEDQHHMHSLMKRLLKGGNQTQLEETGLACHYDYHTEVCVSNRPVRIDTLTMKVYVPYDQGMPEADSIIIPYAKREDKWITGTAVSSVQILRENISTAPACEYTHNVPAVVFSSGGSTGNIFHEFTELIVPLFLTSRHFQSRLHFMVTDFRLQFMSKYKKIFSHLSSYEVINPAANVSVHCFPGAVVGLHYHDHLAIKTTEIPEGYSMLDFKQFLRDSYNLRIRESSQTQTEKPTLILVSRKKSRAFLNEDEMVTMMKALGFRVVIGQPDMMANMDKFAEIVNSCSILVGAHGAGLTNAVFLPEGAVLVQVVGLGIDWISNTYFGVPAPGMGLNYIDYKIEPEESSLISLYGKDHPVIVDPESITSQGYEVGRAVYLLKQNFNIDVVRFRETLVKALGLLGRSAPLG
ncbi:alpha-1,3-arabinosyltransferase XAT3-like [Rhododendron vialii]|uniref:alpha-1,3-arabinosyltransferase XAT3-like n=1 Tax=Rhododendron vialii TaxID=182163 RepID=UPI00265E2E22|nr:alpha-1,3-arabinosyltransferase XAT3-like [Rhododendron vialii]